MRTLHVASGLAVAFTTLAFAHLVFHLFAARHGPVLGPGFWAGMAAAAVIAALSLTGAFLLFRRDR